MSSIVAREAVIVKGNLSILSVTVNSQQSFNQSTNKAINSPTEKIVLISIEFILCQDTLFKFRFFVFFLKICNRLPLTITIKPLTLQVSQ